MCERVYMLIFICFQSTSEQFCRTRFSVPSPFYYKPKFLRDGAKWKLKVMHIFAVVVLLIIINFIAILLEWKEWKSSSRNRQQQRREGNEALVLFHPMTTRSVLSCSLSPSHFSHFTWCNRVVVVIVAHRQTWLCNISPERTYYVYNYDHCHTWAVRAQIQWNEASPCFNLCYCSLMLKTEFCFCRLTSSSQHRYHYINCTVFRKSEVVPVLEKGIVLWEGIFMTT